MSERIRHIVLIKLRPDIDVSVRLEIEQKLRDLGKHADGVLEWIITESLDTRKGTVIIENSLFASQQAFDDFKTSDAHAACTAFLKDFADWTVGDYREITKP